ncbi:hypothetical protein E2542_SST20205 [Spatholobus suberectus]|nr:hypothetical protein E2542_SST20205 [Spatholobus suberectus]
MDLGNMLRGYPRNGGGCGVSPGVRIEDASRKDSDEAVIGRGRNVRTRASETQRTRYVASRRCGGDLEIIDDIHTVVDGDMCRGSAMVIGRHRWLQGGLSFDDAVVDGRVLRLGIATETTVAGESHLDTVVNSLGIRVDRDVEVR